MRRTDAICPACQSECRDVYLASGEPYPVCTCGAQMEWLPRPSAIRPDDIPGGLVIEHGLCNPDGSPRRFYSRTEIAEAKQQRGVIAWSDVYGEERTQDGREYNDWLKSGEAQQQRSERAEMRRAGIRVESPTAPPRSDPREHAKVAQIAREVVGARTQSEARERAERVARDLYRR